MTTRVRTGQARHRRQATLVPSLPGGAENRAGEGRDPPQTESDQQREPKDAPPKCRVAAHRQ